MKGHRRKVLPLAPLTHQPDAIGASSLDFAGRSIGGPPATTKNQQMIDMINIQSTFIYFRLTKRLTSAGA